MDKKQARSRRSRKTRVRIAEQRATRLVVSRSNCHIYAQIIAPEGNKVAAELVGKRIAEKAKTLGIEAVALDRSGFRFHGRVKALAEAARAGGLKF